jgi:ABC-type uncharacterized transport system involved in gliding motility auxiliary subunit
MNSKTGRLRGLILLALTAAVTVAALLFIGRFAFRLDLSADHGQSLSKAARGLYAEIPEKLHITYYISPQVSSRYAGPREIEDLLREFEASSRGRIGVSVEDPTSRTGAVESLGVQGRQMQIVEKNEQRVAVVYSGIVVQYLERSEVIPFVMDGTTLEYDLIKAIRRAVNASPQKLSLLVGDADKSFSNDYKTLSAEFSTSGWQVSELNRGDPVPPDTKVLVVLGNADLDDYDAYRVGEFLARGGAAFIAAKGVGVEARQELSAAPLRQDALLRALSAWGVDVGRSLVLDSSAPTIPVQQAGPSGGIVINYVRYPFWVIVRPENASKDNPITSGMAGLDLFWPSPLVLADRPGIKGEVLVKSTPKAWLQTERFNVRLEDSASFALEAGKTGGQYGLAVSLSGAFPDAWAGKPLPARTGAPKLEAARGQPLPSKLIVVGSSDFATDLMANMQSQFNASFIASAVDWLATGDELATIRARGARDPRLGKIQEPAARNSAILLAYAVNLFVVPGGLVAYGLLRRRKRRKLARPEVRDGQPSATGEAVR